MTAPTNDTPGSPLVGSNFFGTLDASNTTSAVISTVARPQFLIHIEGVDYNTLHTDRDALLYKVFQRDYLQTMRITKVEDILRSILKTMGEHQLALVCADLGFTVVPTR